MQWRPIGKRDYPDQQQKDVAPKQRGAPTLSAVIVCPLVIVAVTRFVMALWKNIGFH
jgi:hypothetical protein